MDQHPQPVIFSPSHCQLGESPCWHPERESLFWLDILARKLYEKAPGQAERNWDLPATASRVILDGCSTNALYLVTDQGLALFRPDTGHFQLLIPIALDEGYRTNDGGVDRQGNLVFGTMKWHPEPGCGKIFRITPQGNVAEIAAGIAIPNTFVWNREGNLLYLADSLQQKIYRFQYDANTPLGTPDIFLTLTQSSATPDGAAIDSDEILWNAQWDGFRVRAYSPEGSFEKEIALPVPRPTSCCFGGPGFRQLFITSAWDGLTTEERDKYSLSGCTFCIECDAAGELARPFTLLDTP